MLNIPVENRHDYFMSLKIPLVDRLKPIQLCLKHYKEKDDAATEGRPHSAPLLIAQQIRGSGKTYFGEQIQETISTEPREYIGDLPFQWLNAFWQSKRLHTSTYTKTPSTWDNIVAGAISKEANRPYNGESLQEVCHNLLKSHPNLYLHIDDIETFLLDPVHAAKNGFENVDPMIPAVKEALFSSFAIAMQPLVNMPNIYTYFCSNSVVYKTVPASQTQLNIFVLSMNKLDERAILSLLSSKRPNDPQIPNPLHRDYNFISRYFDLQMRSHKLVTAQFATLLYELTKGVPALLQTMLAIMYAQRFNIHTIAAAMVSKQAQTAKLARYIQNFPINLIPQVAENEWGIYKELTVFAADSAWIGQNNFYNPQSGGEIPVIFECERFCVPFDYMPAGKFMPFTTPVHLYQMLQQYPNKVLGTPYQTAILPSHSPARRYALYLDFQFTLRVLAFQLSPERKPEFGQIFPWLMLTDARLFHQVELRGILASQRHPQIDHKRQDFATWCSKKKFKLLELDPNNNWLLLLPESRKEPRYLILRPHKHEIVIVVIHHTYNESPQSGFDDQHGDFTTIYEDLHDFREQLQKEEKINTTVRHWIVSPHNGLLKDQHYVERFGTIYLRDSAFAL